VVAALALLGELPRPGPMATALLMGPGIWLHVTELHDHPHEHDALAHEHRHSHDEHRPRRRR